SQVEEFKPGDHVIACLSVFCGRCEYCLTGRTHLCATRPVRAKDAPPRLTWNGQAVNQFANLSGYAERMLVHSNAIVKIRDDMPLDRAALIGCGVTTGVGAVLAGARMIIGVDVHDHKLETAYELGATHTINASRTDPVTEIRELTNGGVDYAFEAIGLKKAAEQCFDCLRAGEIGRASC